MNRNTSLNSVSQKTVIHPEFMPCITINQTGIEAFLRAIAVNAVGQAITLAAIGIKVTAMIMPNMSQEPRCQLTLPKGAWVNSLNCMENEKKRQTRFLEMICWQISGAVAEFAFDKSDYYGNLGLEDIEGSYEFLSAYEAGHSIPGNRVLAGCTVVVERLLGHHYEVAEAMAEHLATHGRLDEREIARYLSCVPVEYLGQQALASFQEPWIEDETERVFRMFIASA